jgi:hypothetical protein
MSEALTDAQHRETTAIAELEVRRYFDHYLKNVYPQQREDIEEHINTKVQAHDDADCAHGCVEKRLNRLTWIVIGAALTGSAGGAGLVRVLMGLG